MKGNPVRRSVRIALAAGSVMLVSQAFAVSTKSWNTATYKDFEDGTADHAQITSLGEVMPGVTTKRIDLESEMAWTAVRGQDGTVYTAGVSDGAIYAVTPGGKKKLASLEKDTPWIGSLLLDGNTLYAGTLGTGTIEAVDVHSGKVTRLAKLDGVTQIWAMVLDATGKTLYAGTGPNSKLFSVELGSGTAKSIWESGDKPLMSVIRAADGALWLGTSDEAILFRYDPR